MEHDRPFYWLRFKDYPQYDKMVYLEKGQTFDDVVRAWSGFDVIRSTIEVPDVGPITVSVSRLRKD